jgi:FkbM family methyltransferase
MSMIDLVSAVNFLKTLNSCINIIDVGACGGGFRDRNANLVGDNAYWLGIEPNPYLPKKTEYNQFLNVAIHNVDVSTSMKFNIHRDYACSSLSRLKNEILTSNVAEKDKWWCTTDIQTINTVVDVKVCSLKSILNDFPKFQNELIHIVKIDAQGIDIHVAKSLREYLDKTIFIILECVTSTDSNVVLYDDQTLIADDIKTMSSLGFSVYKTLDYTSTGTPEADVMFINNKWKELCQ